MIYLLTNNEVFQEHKFGDESIRHESKLVKFKINTSSPGFKHIFLKSSELNDNSDFFDFTGGSTTTFQSFDLTELALDSSSWTKFPSDTNPNGLFKYASLDFYVDRNLRSIKRQTQGFLDWLSGIGGIAGSLVNFGGVLMGPYSAYAVQFMMASLMVFYRPSR